jgi:cell division septation protein DedD
MKQCPVCKRLYADDLQIYCLDDGTVLSAPYDSEATLINAPVRITDARTEVLPGRTAADTAPYPPVVVSPTSPAKPAWPTYVIIALLALIAGGGLVAILTWRTPGGSRADGNLPNSSNPSNGNVVALPSTPSTSSNQTTSNSARVEGSSNSARPPGPGDAWFVILGSFSKHERSRADERVEQLRQAGWRVEIIDTNSYPGLAPGLWAVVMGPMPQSEAQYLADQLAKGGEKAYIKAGW